MYYTLVFPSNIAWVNFSNLKVINCKFGIFGNHRPRTNNVFTSWNWLGLGWPRVIRLNQISFAILKLGNKDRQKHWLITTPKKDLFWLENFLLDSLQIIQNKAARSVTRRGRYTPIVELLSHCGWLSVRQLVIYHSVILIYKTIQTTYPKYIFNKLSSEFPYNTRLAQSESVRMGPEFQTKLELTEKSFMSRATVSFNKLPASIRQISKIGTFKKKLKTWVLENIHQWSNIVETPSKPRM